MVAPDRREANPAQLTARLKSCLFKANLQRSFATVVVADANGFVDL